MHSHLCGSHRAMFDDDDFNSYQGIACEGHRHTHNRLEVIYIQIFKGAYVFQLKTKTSSICTLSKNISKIPF